MQYLIQSTWVDQKKNMRVIRLLLFPFHMHLARVSHLQNCLGAGVIGVTPFGPFLTWGRGSLLSEKFTSVIANKMIK